MITVWCSLIAAIVFLLVDQCTKAVVSHYMQPGDSFSVIKNFFSIEYVQNRGAAFGMMQNFRYVFIVLAVCVILLIIIALVKGKIKNKYLIWSLSLIVSGGVGNTIDRIVNRGGYVIDFFKFEFSWFPYVFNVADICVTVGGAVLIIYLISDIIMTEKSKRLALKQSDKENSAEHYKDED